MRIPHAIVQVESSSFITLTDIWENLDSIFSCGISQHSGFTIGKAKTTDSSKSGFEVRVRLPSDVEERWVIMVNETGVTLLILDWVNALDPLFERNIEKFINASRELPFVYTAETGDTWSIDSN